MKESRKYQHAAFVQLVGAVALFTGHVDGGTFVALSTLCLAIYSAANVADKKMGGSG